MTPGSRIGPYVVVHEIGAGAMGQVVLARDERLDRMVALKSLPAVFADDAERLARFEREARMLAALHHPHVASLFGLEDFDGHRFLVMEYVEGETLAERMARGGVDLGEAMKLAEQIARGLAAAHDRGIVHRDLKPSNVMVTPAGHAKVVDFGLAKDVNRSPTGAPIVVQSASRDDPVEITGVPSTMPNRPGDLEVAPTVVTGPSALAGDGARGDPLATEPGAVLGTAAYMSPEQARGRPVDRRCDVWAFGCVVFEMLAGCRPFAGANLVQTMRAVLQDEPPWDTLPLETPPTVERLLRRCLRKDPDERLRDLGDAALELRDFRAGRLGEVDGGRGADRGAAHRLRRTLLAVLGLVATGLVLLAVPWPDPRPATSAATFTLPTPDLDWGRVVETNVAVAPDGGSWVYRSTTEGSPLMLRRLDENEPVPIPGTEDARNPFFSPDGRHLGFTRDLDLVRLEPFQGSPRVLVSLSEGGFMGRPSWGDNGSILYTTLPGGVFRIDAEGGEVTKLLDQSDVPGATLLGWPEHLGDEGLAVFAAVDDGLKTLLVSPDGRSHRRLDGVRSRTVFLEPDLLVFVRERQLLAQKMDLATARLVGEPVILAPGVAWDERTGNAGFDISPTLLVAVQRELVARMQWFARDGEPLGILGEPADLWRPRISPDGTRVAVGIANVSGGAEDLWVFDLEREVGSRLTHTPAAESTPVWSPDGRRLGLASDAGGPPDIVIRRADAGGEERILARGEDAYFPSDWLPDGSALVYQSYTTLDTYLAPVDGSPAVPWLVAEGTQTWARASPDGRWMVFESDELGTPEIFAAPLADSGRRLRVSTQGGRDPIWSPDGESIFFVSGRAVYEVPIDTESGRIRDQPRPVFEVEGPDRVDTVEIHPDGSRFLLTLVDETRRRPSMLVRMGWRQTSTRRPVDDG